MIMISGYMNKILRVDLSSSKIAYDQIDDKTLRMFIGGGGLAVKILYDEFPPGYDVYDGRNPVVFMTGPATGTAVPASCLYVAVSKSPLTGFTVARARSNGSFAPELKFAGFDGVVVTGKADRPVYLWIHEGESEIRDATDLWGKDTHETMESIPKELGDPKVKVACIGQAGEVLSRGACIVSNGGHVAARGGQGAIMGSKKLKAIAVRGTNKIPVHDSDALNKIVVEWRKLALATKHGQNLRDFGTAGRADWSKAREFWPIKNLTSNQIEKAENYSGEYLVGKYPTTKKGETVCFNCPYLHDRTIEIPEGPYKGVYAFPEYEDCAGFGANLGIGDTEAVIKLTDMANRFGMDAVETGFTISMVMEAYEKGLLHKEDADGLELNWGNAEAVKSLLEKIKTREGIGNILAEGVKRAADCLGCEELTVHIKNMAPMQHDIRTDWGKLLGYTVAGAGPVHEGVGSYQLPDPDIGFPTLLPLFEVARKGEAVAKDAFKRFLSSNMGICDYPARDVPISYRVNALNAITGWDVDLDEALETSEREITLTRAFNVRHGLRPEDDWPSPRLLEAIPGGPHAGITGKNHLKHMIRDYYRQMGWDEKTGKPLVSTLKRLGLEQVIKDLW